MVPPLLFSFFFLFFTLPPSGQANTQQVPTTCRKRKGTYWAEPRPLVLLDINLRPASRSAPKSLNRLPSGWAEMCRPITVGRGAVRSSDVRHERTTYLWTRTYGFFTHNFASGHVLEQVAESHAALAEDGVGVGGWRWKVHLPQASGNVWDIYVKLEHPKCETVDPILSSEDLQLHAFPARSGSDVTGRWLKAIQKPKYERGTCFSWNRLSMLDMHTQRDTHTRTQAKKNKTKKRHHSYRVVNIYPALGPRNRFNSPIPFQ